jgi:putative transposase
MKSEARSRRTQRRLIDRNRSGHCSIRRGCNVIELPRSTYYYRSTAMSVGLNDARLVELIEVSHDEFPGYGYRRVT